MNKIIPLLFLMVFAIGCNNNRVFKEYKEITDYEWAQDNTLTYDVKAVEKDQSYTLSLAFRYINGFPYRNVAFEIKIIAPGGDVKELTYNMQVISDNKEYKGEAGYDIWDLDEVVNSDLKFDEAGDYKIEVNQVSQESLQLVMEVGIYLDKNGG